MSVPSLSSLAYLRCVDRSDPLWQRTAAACWSETNPYWSRGKVVEGIGGPHVGLGHVWPMSLIMRGFSYDRDVRTLRNILRRC